MSQKAKICHECKKPITTKDGFSLESTGEHFHGKCFNCQECGQNCVNKRTGKIPDENGREKRVCHDCLMKKPEFQMLMSGNFDNLGGPPPVVSDKNLICTKCNKKIIGQAKKTKNGNYYHPDCYFKCFKCSVSLANKQYAVIGGNKWCSDCVSKRNKEVGDITTNSNKKTYNTGKLWYENDKKLKEARKNLYKPGTNPKHQVEYKTHKICTSCRKVIYGPSFNVGDNKELVFHKKCLTCDDCKKQTPPLQLVMHGHNKKYCKNCASKYRLNM